MAINQEKILKTLHPRRIWWPVGIGLGFVVLMAFLDPNLNATTFGQIRSFDPSIILWLLLMLAVKDTAYIMRMKYISEGRIPFHRGFYVIILWEFANAVTPSFIGGTGVAIFILMMERLSFGRSLAYVAVMAIMDDLFFVIAAPLVFLLASQPVFPQVSDAQEVLGKSLQGIFYSSYGLLVLYSLLMSYGVLINPRGFKRLILRITSFRLLRRVRRWAYHQANEIVLAGRALRNKGFSYWLPIIFFTIIAWSARYALVNVLLSENQALAIADHLMVFGRHVILWIIMLLSPTPGSSGTAEYFFQLFYGTYSTYNPTLQALLWRLSTYYPYLLLGALLLPRWLRDGLQKNRESFKM